MKIKIIAMTENPLMVMASAIAITRGKDYEEFQASCNDAEIKRLITDCYESYHMTPFEHVDIDFEVLGVSRVFEADRIRSRHQNILIEAGRFTEKRDFETVVPPYYSPDEVVERLAIIREWNNIDKKRKIPANIRRYWTHQGLSRRMRTKQNMSAWIYTAGLRMCTCTQWEYKEFMKKVKEAITERSSFLASFLKPKCERLGYCTEIWNPCRKYPSKETVLTAAAKQLSIIV